jgi:hypothetical protein
MNTWILLWEGIFKLLQFEYFPYDAFFEDWKEQKPKQTLD